MVLGGVWTQYHVSITREVRKEIRDRCRVSVCRIQGKMRELHYV